MNSSKLEQLGLQLIATEEGLTLTDGTLSLRGDFTEMQYRLRPSNLHRELLVRAAKIKHPDPMKRPLAIDATAGMGEDALLLAAAGYQVIMYEYNEVIAALLEDTLKRAQTSGTELSQIVEHMTLLCENSMIALPELQNKADIILLDPMFASRQKNTLVKKKFQLVSRLEAPCDNGEELFQAAKAASPGKIIVKRPLKGKTLTQENPGYSISGKNIRYDCYVL